MLGFLRKLFGGKARTGAVGAEDALPRVEWIPAAENPFGVDLLDCAAFCRSAKVPAKELPAIDGERYRGQLPAHAATVPCDLTFPYDGKHRDGPLFEPEQAEDAWEVFLYDGRLSFVRTWTGELSFVADIAFESGQVRLTSLVAAAEFADDPSHARAVVDYLIKSLLHGAFVPHPLPPRLSKEPRALAEYSFALYGRRAQFGTFSDTTQFRVPVPEIEQGT